MSLLWVPWRCPACGRVSHNPNDIVHRYCPGCGRPPTAPIPTIQETTVPPVMRWHARLEFVLADCWIGCYWRKGYGGRLDVWICLLPCVPLHISHGPRWWP